MKVPHPHLHPHSSLFFPDPWKVLHYSPSAWGWTTSLLPGAAQTSSVELGSGKTAGRTRWDAHSVFTAARKDAGQALNVVKKKVALSQISVLRFLRHTFFVSHYCHTKHFSSRAKNSIFVRCFTECFPGFQMVTLIGKWITTAGVVGVWAHEFCCWFVWFLCRI